MIQLRSSRHAYVRSFLTVRLKKPLQPSQLEQKNNCAYYDLQMLSIDFAKYRAILIGREDLYLQCYVGELVVTPSPDAAMMLLTSSDQAIINNIQC